MDIVELKNILDSGATGDELMEKFGSLLARNPADLRKWLPPVEPFVPHAFCGRHHDGNGKHCLYITYLNHEDLYNIHRYLLQHRRETRHRRDGLVSPFGDMDQYCLLYRFSYDFITPKPIVSWTVPRTVLNSSHYLAGRYENNYSNFFKTVERYAFMKPTAWFDNNEFKDDVYDTGLYVVLRQIKGFYKLFLESDVPLTPSQEEAFVMMKLRWS